MAISFPESELLLQTARQLDASIRELCEKELSLVCALGPDRVDALRELRDRALSREEELELTRSLDWRDRELLLVWSRLRRARSARVNVGHAAMRNGASGGQAAAERPSA